jgi:hypothetical protein
MKFARKVRVKDGHWREAMIDVHVKVVTVSEVSEDEYRKSGQVKT